MAQNNMGGRLKVPTDTFSFAIIHPQIYLDVAIGFIYGGKHFAGYVFIGIYQECEK